MQCHGIPLKFMSLLGSDRHFEFLVQNLFNVLKGLEASPCEAIKA